MSTLDRKLVSCFALNSIFVCEKERKGESDIDKKEENVSPGVEPEEKSFVSYA